MSEFSLNDLVKSESVDGLEGILKNIQKYDSAITKIEGLLTHSERLLNRLDSLGIIRTVLRATGKKYGIDVETPLQQDNTVKPSSESHKLLFDQLNTLNEDQLKEFSYNFVKASENENAPKQPNK
jgi:hypothetical protein